MLKWAFDGGVEKTYNDNNICSCEIRGTTTPFVNYRPEEKEIDDAQSKRGGGRRDVRVVKWYELLF